MSLRRTVPLVWRPHGLSDTLDASTAFPGAMGKLTNLIPDVSTRDLWQCRPASISLVDFASDSNPWSSGWSSGFGGAVFVDAGFISALLVLGTRVYGMMATEDFPGYDQPFCYDTSISSIVPITGPAIGNLPTNAAASGAWTPPHMELVGTRIMVTHSGFDGTGNYIGWIDVSDPTNPTWSAGNLTGAITLSTVPSWVANFNGRAYYLVNPATGQPSAIFSDQLAPTTVTNANQVLTFGDNLPLTCARGLPLNNMFGGIIQSLIVFKGATNMYQVTGDSATSDLAVNAMNIATGTLAPNTVCPTPEGLAFVAPDGLRIVDFRGNVGNPIGEQGDGVTVPFISTAVPSRMCAACNVGVIRISTQNTAETGSPHQEYWYDMKKRVWSGPHTCIPSLIQPYQGSFILTPYDVTAHLFQGDVVVSSGSTFIEHGTQLTFAFETAMLPDSDDMCENNMLETTIYMQLYAGASVAVYAQDQDGASIDNVQFTQGSAATQWGAFTWGQALWGGAQSALYPKQCEWSVPIVFRRLALGATGDSGAGLRIGPIHMRYEKLGYLQQPQQAVA